MGELVLVAVFGLGMLVAAWVLTRLADLLAEPICWVLDRVAEGLSRLRRWWRG
jgi:hypothetical protein